jgi:hypothetical protein
MERYSGALKCSALERMDIAVAPILSSCLMRRALVPLPMSETYCKHRGGLHESLEAVRT